MPGYFKKRRKPSGPNKNQKKVMRGEEAARLRTLSQLYPEVQSLDLQLTFSSPIRALLGEESRAFGPQDPCDFSVPCPGACGEGSFDLATKIQQVIGTHQDHSESKGQCQRPSYVSPSALCGCLLDCTISVNYL